MNNICSFCLSADRNLNGIEEKCWKILNLFIDVDQKSFVYIQYLHSANLLRICWECCARITKFNLFLQRAQKSCLVFAQCLELGQPENPLVPQTKLIATEVENINLPAVKCESNKSIDSVTTDKPATHYFETDNIQDNPQLINTTHEIVDKLETNSIVDEIENNHHDESIDHNFTTPNNDDDDDDDDSDDNRLFMDDDISSVAVVASNKKKNTKSEANKKIKRLQSRFVPRESQVSWVLESQALQWYKEEREAEREANPNFSLQCDACKRVFPTEEALTEHFKEHHSEDAGCFVCNLCQYRFVDAMLLRQHHEIHYAKFQCIICNYETRMYKDMESHVKNNHAKLFRCTRCKEEIAATDKRRHLRVCGVYKCANCEATYSDRSSYKSHVTTHKKQTEGTTYCEGCKSYIRNTWYEKHFTVSLKHVSKDTFKFTCEHCGAKKVTAALLRTHIFTVHLKSGLYQCELCPKKYMTERSLQQHLDTRHKTEPIKKEKDKICEQCGKGFVSNTLLNQHRRVHTGERPYKCDYCPARYPCHGSLYAHNVNVHRKRISKTGAADAEKVPCNECDRTFLSNAGLRLHVKSAHLNIRFQCDFCDKNFLTKLGLTSHKAKQHNHVNTFKYTCSCGKSFETEKGLKLHKHTSPKEKKAEKRQKCRDCDETFNPASYYMHYKLKHLKLRKNDRVSIKNLHNLDKEVVVIRSDS